MNALALRVLARSWVAAALVLAMPSGAETTTVTAMPDLPALPLVEKVLAAYPPVRAAREGIKAESANARRLEAGPYEFQIRGGYQSHSLSTGRYPEVDVGLERALRLPDKGVLDREIGAQNVELARRLSYSAWCDGARRLLELWFGWARENVQLELWRQQVEALRSQSDVVAKRARAGDAPRVEVNLAEAAAAQAEAVMANLEGREAGARGALERTFAGLVVPPRAMLAEPSPLGRPLDWYLERVRAHNDEVRVARAATRRGLLLASRSGAERRPDPSVGVRIATDRSTQDRMAGIYFVLPLPGAARQAFAESAQSQAAAAASHEAAVVGRVSADAANMYGRAQGAFAAWQRARAAAEGMARNAASQVRSWQLHEASLNDVLVARRLALESALGASLAQIETAEARYRLLVEAHILWNDPEEEREPHED